MAEKIRKNIWFVLLVFFFFLLDGTLAQFLSPFLHTATHVMVPRLFLIMLICGSFYYNEHFILVLSLVMGILYDSYYTGILGVYAACVPVIALLTVKLAKYVNDSFLIASFTSIIALSIFEFGIFCFQKGLNLLPETTDLTEFIVIHLGPTIVFNMIAFVILYYPLKKLLQRITRNQVMSN